MKKYKICVYVICKNEEKFVDRFMDSVEDADLVVAMDTGSTDDTMKKLKKRGAKVYSVKCDPFRFDYCRNKCLEKIPNNIDICVSADLDEVIQPGWRECLEKYWEKDTTRGLYLYNWSFNEDGTPATQYTHQRIHCRHGFKWIYPTHEVLKYTGEGTEKQVFIKGLVYNHYPDRAKSRSFNLPLLELAVEENPNDPRNYHYLGREYMYAQMWDKCIDTLQKYLNLPNANWNEERCAAMRFISRAYKAKNDIINARKWLYKAIAEAPHLREPYVEMSRLLYLNRDWNGIYYFANEALLITNKSMGYPNECFAWDYTPYDLAALGSHYLGMQEKAIKFSLKAMELAPNDERLKTNHKFYTKAN